MAASRPDTPSAGPTVAAEVAAAQGRPTPKARVFAPTGRRGVATGAARASRAQPVESLPRAGLPRRGRGTSTVRVLPSFRTHSSAPAGAGLFPACLPRVSLRSTRGYTPTPRRGVRSRRRRDHRRLHGPLGQHTRRKGADVGSGYCNGRRLGDRAGRDRGDGGGVVNRAGKGEDHGGGGGGRKEKRRGRSASGVSIRASVVAGSSPVSLGLEVD